MTVSKYIVFVQHDQGTLKITTAATSEDSARQMVMNAEHCPPQAITKVIELKPRSFTTGIELIREVINGNLPPFDAIEVHPVMLVDVDQSGKEFYETCEDEAAHFYSVYVHQKTGGIICVADCQTEETANLLADLLNAALAERKQVTELLKRAVKFMNAVPNNRYGDNYSICRDIDDYLNGGKQ